ncbi:arginine-ornithine antiporter [Staphylococcus sp. EG-SA-6]|uniref:Arginine-ornithine antiporter n=4 Tax=Staphylococcus haemolyticus TaxID=1283 RepID=A0A7Z1SBS9_STAHA|nr:MULTISPECIES: arginine-ornithine antiporter [Staphylococcus]KDP49125.1 arginine-ornithine antiporter [Staphylococcus aureus subsp. aureus CO-98]MBN4933217.1 arginine-ornithine antiporter [Staphylococcus sp. EG-SA-6]MDU2097973.1 arginine-ornithine antiporter [Staphylococcus sp.]SII40728.1 arginine/ornithine antiporter [Mycobacteroides abscessus subsp. abscessus]AKC75164.1 arginine/ornithine APC family amino acid-polyamine-organocation transporter, antiporter [Staphylococcus haemolyticus]
MNESDTNKLGKTSLIGLVIGSMIGGGAFNIISDMGGQAGGLAIMIGWIITAIGMISLAFVFQNLTNVRPDLEGGIYSYAQAGFGDFIGFSSAWGYWFAAFLGNVAYATLLMSAIGNFFPIFKGGNTLPSIIVASFLLWGVHFLILRGVETAAFINSIVTVAKLIPIFLVIICMIVVFNFDTFKAGFYGMTSGGTGIFSWGDTMSQVKSTMLVTVWVFTGIEGAVVFSGRAKSKKDVGTATVIGLVSVLVIYFLMTVLAQGVIQQNQIADLASPSMAQVLEHIVGHWGSVLVNIGLIISVLGAWLGWTLLAGELPFIVAKDGLFPKWFAKENKNKAPINALLITNILVQIFLISMLFTDSAYQFAFSLASSAILIPYMFSAFYQLKYTIEHKGHATVKQWAIGIIASIYAIWLVYAAGIDYLLLTMLLYIPGLFVYRFVQRNNHKPLTKGDYILFAVIIILAIIGIIRLAMGSVSVF